MLDQAGLTERIVADLEQVRATAYIAHPYQFPIIGWPSDIASWTIGDLERFYRTYYAPNNITMVVTGDVTPEEILDLAEEYLEDLPAQEPPAEVRTVEPPQQGERRIVIEADAQTPMLHIAFHAGRAADPETLAMNLLLGILIDGDSSRLHRVLVEEEQLAIAIGGFQFEGFDPGLVYFYATLPPGGDLALLEDHYTTASGREVTLRIYSEHENIDQCHHAMASLKKSMAWVTAQ